MILDYRLIIVQQDMFVKIMSTTRITMVSWEKFYLWYIHVYVTLTLRQPRSLTYNLSKIWRFSTEKKKVQNLISSLNGLVHRIIQVFHFNIQHADIGGIGTGQPQQCVLYHIPQCIPMNWKLPNINFCWKQFTWNW